MIAESLGVPRSAAKSLDELTDTDRYMATVISEARRLYREGMEKQKG